MHCSLRQLYKGGERLKKSLKWILFVCVFFLQLSFLGGCGKKEVVIVDNAGKEIEVLSETEYGEGKMSEAGHRAYVEVVMDEAIQIVSEEKNCSIDEAEKLIFQEGYSLYTVFEEEIYNAIAESKLLDEKVSMGCAVTDLKGNLLAAYSAGDYEQEYQNFATKDTAPYSSFKPLSVYAPAIESGIATWSTTYMDEPIKQIEDESGRLRDWPANATGTYSNEGVGVYEAIEKSLNTIAVRCLQEYGVKNSLTFMKEKFGLTLEFEESRTYILGEEETIGNIALGYLQDGVSPIDMAGYYQVFANGGSYTEPKTIRKICDGDGKVIYERETESKQVISGQTSYIMNQLLQNVVSAGGTGKKAQCEGILVGGKTGTGDIGNWFVGFTPEYTCAVWHGISAEKNQTAELFADIVSKFEYDESLTFPENDGVQKIVFCEDSGMSVSSDCRKIKMGYYSLAVELPICDKHK